MLNAAAAPNANNASARVRALVESTWLQRTITGLIIINAITLGLETVPAAIMVAGPVLTLVDRTILAVFVAELALKLFAYRWRYFASGWNWFDAVLIVFSVVPASGNLSVLRALRILRMLRLLSVVPQMRRVVEALLKAVPGMMSIIAVLVLIFYVAAVLATKLFGGHHDPAMQEWFGSIPASMYTLFQVMTLESWSMGIVRPTMELFPYSWIFFVPFIVVTSFAVLNLFIAIVVNAMQSEHEAEHAEQAEAGRVAAQAEREELRAELSAVRKSLARLESKLERIDPQ